MAIPEAESAVCDCLVCWCGHHIEPCAADVMAKLLAGFVWCLDDKFVAVRAEACTAASRLRLRDNSHQQSQ